MSFIKIRNACSIRLQWLLLNELHSASQLLILQNHDASLSQCKAILEKMIKCAFVAVSSHFHCIIHSADYIFHLVL